MKIFASALMLGYLAQIVLLFIVVVTMVQGKRYIPSNTIPRNRQERREEEKYLKTKRKK